MKHILILRLSAMGDVAMTVPVIRALIAQHSNVRVTVVSRPFFRPFFDNIDRVDFFGVDLKKRHKGFLGLYRMFLDLKKLKIDFFADFHNVLRSKIVRNFFFFSGTKVAFTDKGRNEKKALTQTENKVFKPVKPMINRHLETLKQLGFHVNLENPNFPKKLEITKNITEITGSKTNLWIGIAPFAQYQTKVYPKDLMEEVILKLSRTPEHKIFLFGGGKQEIELLNEMQQNIENVIVLAGKLSFEEELTVIQNLNVMLSMDSGNAHIAAMFGVPVVSLWGQTHPFAGFTPFNQPQENSLTANREKYPLIPTSIYGNKEIPGYENAMRSILPESIISRLQLILNKTSHENN